MQHLINLTTFLFQYHFLHLRNLLRLAKKSKLLKVDKVMQKFSKWLTEISLKARQYQQHD